MTTTELELTGQEIQAALHAIAGGQSGTGLAQERWPALVALRLHRARQKLVTAIEPYEAERKKLIAEHGNGDRIDPEDTEAMTAFLEDYRTVMAEPATIEFEPLRLSDIEAVAKANGRAGPMVTADALGTLIEAGIIVEDEDKDATGDEPDD